MLFFNWSMRRELKNVLSPATRCSISAAFTAQICHQMN